MTAPATPRRARDTAATRPALLLASASPYRRLLLERLGLEFRCQAADVDEALIDGPTAEQRARRRARAKAAAVARGEPGPALVIGCDQVAAIGGHALDKPGTPERAEAQLAAASGRCIELCSAVHVEPAGTGQAAASACAHARVHLRRLDRDEIRRYVVADRPLDCVGAFRIDARGALLMQRIECDDPGTIVGLPLIALARLLRGFGLDPLRG